jgi:hypothetical protein
MDGYAIGDMLFRACILVALLYAGFLLARGTIRLVARLFSVRATDVAQAAGSASAKLERKAGSIAEAFKQGRNRS